MKVNKTIMTLAGLMFLLSGCAGMQIEIPRSDVQKKIEKKFPIRKEALVAHTELTEPEVYFRDEKVGIRLAFVGVALGKKVEGTADVRGELVYKREKKKFYVENLKIIELTVRNKKVSKSIAIRAVINNLVLNKLDGIAVYTLNDEKRKERFASAYMEKIEVNEDDDCLVITLGHRQ